MNNITNKMNAGFKAGNVVQLKSGSVDMTIAQVGNGGWANLYYQENHPSSLAGSETSYIGEIKTIQNVPVTALVLVRE